MIQIFFRFYNTLNFENKKGATLIIFLSVMVVLSILFVSFMGRSIGESRAVIRNIDTIQAYYLAEAGIDQVKRELYEEFRDNQYDYTEESFDWFNDLPDNYPGGIPTDVALASLPSATYSVQITNVDTSTSVPKDVTVLSTAEVNGISKNVTAVIRYTMSPSKVFDFSYFINNHGWLVGGGITSQGDVRSNGDFSFTGNPTINGDIYASINADLGTTGTISGNSRNDSIDFYRSNADSEARPTNPTADAQDITGDGIPEEFPYENGYDGESERFPGQQELDLPFLGDLSYYQSLAIENNGTVKQGGVTLVNNVLTGNVVLIGTDANPIELDGPVVVTGDVLIKGKVTGQGTIYSGRNAHILGEVHYVDPPSWPKPDTDPTATDAVNNTKDFLGLAAKGNVIIGDYTRNDWQVSVNTYLQPPFTQAHEIDPTDVALGYASYYLDGDPYFDGNYMANDGGTKDDGSNRKFYESSYNDAYFSSIAENASQIRKIDVVTFTNHAVAGKVGSFTLNGSIVARDEAIIYSGSITANYDIRAKNMGQNFYLPRALALPHIQYMKRN